MDSFLTQKTSNKFIHYTNDGDIFNLELFLQ